MREIKCKQCGKVSIKYDREATMFCNRDCYMAWKREHPNRKPYKSEIIINNYAYIYKPGHLNAIKDKRYVAKHRLVAEEKIGRELNENEVAHHINGDTLDNRPENIEVLTVSKHNKLTANNRERDINGKLQ